MADASAVAPLAVGAGAGSEDDDDGAGSATDVALASSVFVFCCCFDAISFTSECLINVFFLRMLELDCQTVGVLSYICTLNCQSIRA